MKSFLIISPKKEATSLIQSSIPDDCKVETAANIKTARCLQRNHYFDIIFFDLDVSESDTPKRKYADIIDLLRESNPRVCIVILTSKETIREAVKMVKAGANDYLSYPIEPIEVRLVIRSLYESLTQDLELDYLRDRFWKTEWLDHLQTYSKSMRMVYKKIRAVAPTKATVMLIGETGTGKSMLARLVHLHSNRCDDPFISVHCGAIPDTLLESELFGHEKGAFTGAVRMKMGKFEMARTGTVFLDEIGTITPAAQVKLLQVLQDGIFNRVGGEQELKTDARIIAATNSDLSGMCDRGTFRKDLYYRLNLFPIELPTLQERREDIPYLIDRVLKKLNTMHGKSLHSVHPQVIRALQNYNWPGNIRELENLMERAYILESTSILTPENFPNEIFEIDIETAVLPINTHLSIAEARQKAVGEFERQYLMELFSHTKGRVTVAAKEAGISTRQLNKLMVKHGIRKEVFKK
jgi:DNA-binding NtrC family response regulator